MDREDKYVYRYRGTIMDTEEQYWIQKNNIQIQRDNIGYRRTISDTEEQYLDTKEQYWIQRDNIGYRRTI